MRCFRIGTANEYTVARTRSAWMEAPLGPLDDSARAHIENRKLESRLFCQLGQRLLVRRHLDCNSMLRWHSLHVIEGFETAIVQSTAT